MGVRIRQFGGHGGRMTADPAPLDPMQILMA
jgi:hypothetical protein